MAWSYLSKARKNPRNFRFVTLPWKFRKKTKFHPWKIRKTVINQKTLPMKIPQLSLDHPWKLHFNTQYLNSFFNTYRNFMSSIPPVLIFFCTSPMQSRRSLILHTCTYELINKHRMKKIWMLLTTFLKAGATIRAQGNMIYLIFWLTWVLPSMSSYLEPRCCKRTTPDLREFRVRACANKLTAFCLALHLSCCCTVPAGYTGGWA